MTVSTGFFVLAVELDSGPVFLADRSGALGLDRLTGALLDRITHHVNILEMNGDSYRLAQSRARKAD